MKGKQRIHPCFKRAGTHRTKDAALTARGKITPVLGISIARPEPPDPNEPAKLAMTIAELRLAHVVIASVDRDERNALGDSLSGRAFQTVARSTLTMPHRL
jgi:lipoate synthase